MSRRRRRSLVGKFLSELRRSHAAGLHVKTTKDRANTRRKVIEQDKKDSS
jgi:hypothetical protein